MFSLKSVIPFRSLFFILVCFYLRLYILLNSTSHDEQNNFACFKIKGEKIAIAGDVHRCNMIHGESKR